MIGRAMPLAMAGVLLAPAMAVANSAPMTLMAGLAVAAVADEDDTVFLANGGRIRGRILEADPTRGVTVQLADGTVRKLTPAEVANVKYAGDAPSGGNPVPPPEPPPPPPSPAPQYQPPPEQGEEQAPRRPRRTGRRAAPEPENSADATDPLAEQTGFQMAMRVGLALPSGNVDTGAPMSDSFGTQTGVLFELGGKPTPHLFIGAIFGGAAGGVGPAIQMICTNFDASCSSTTGLFGVEFQYHLQPGAQINPWIGYAAALEFASIDVVAPDGTKGSLTLNGHEWVNVMAGLDLRLNHYVGLGGYVDLGIGTYTSIDDSTDGTTMQIPDANQDTHMWLALGVRAVLFP